MRVLAGLLLGAGCLTALLLPAGTPALEAAYILTTDRLTQGISPYAGLPTLLDPLLLYLYMVVGESATYFLRAWKVLGGVGLAIFFWQSRSRLFQTDSALLPGSIGLALYLFRPWGHPLEVGEPVLWWLLLLGRHSQYPFLRGILTGLGMGLFPLATLSGVWIVYRRLEERAGQALLFWGAGVLWSLLGLAAGLHLLALLNPYTHTYWLFVWHYLTDTPLHEWLLRAGAFLLLLISGQDYFRQPYTERRAYRDRLWAGTMTLLLPAPVALWVALLLETRGSAVRRIASMVLFMGQAFLWGKAGLDRPPCTFSLPPGGCLWGEPPCYVRLHSPYACDWVAPFFWREAVRRPDWETFYDRWGSPAYIIDAAGFWSEARYFLPHLSAPYALRDTLLPGARLYQRR